MNSHPSPPTTVMLPVSALGYWGLATLARTHFAPAGMEGIFWPAAGWALAMVLLFGRRQIPAVMLGAMIASLVGGDGWVLSLFSAASAGTGAWAGQSLLDRPPRFDPQLHAIGDYFRLLVRGSAMAGLASGLVGSAGPVLVGVRSLAELSHHLLHGWGANALGVMAITPLVLAWRKPRIAPRWKEGALCLALVFLVNQIVFLGWFTDLMPAFPRKGYWLIPLMFWSAARLGLRHMTLLLVLMAVQSTLAARESGLFFSGTSVDARLVDAWSFNATVSLLGMSLALYLHQRRRSEADLRIAATAFECQEGMIVTDSARRVLRTNRSFSAITGYSGDEVLGQDTRFMRSDRHPAAFYDRVWQTVWTQGSWAGEMWHRRKNGEVYPSWVAMTAVKDPRGLVTNCVTTHTDLTALKKREAEQQARQTAQRDALIREVHHRIKNSLQGVTGVLRQFARTHPQTEDIMSHAISLVRGISVLHGLQGRPAGGPLPSDAVRLEDLLQSMAQDLKTVWKTPITVDLAPGLSYLVAATETVPIVMVLSELLVNAIKHGGAESGHVGITLGEGETRGVARITISNEGRLDAPDIADDSSGGGLMLIESMMPREGASMTVQQLGEYVVTRLELSAPVVTLEHGSSHAAP